MKLNSVIIWVGGRILMVLSAAVLLAVVAGRASAADTAKGPILKVGITPEYPPLVFRQPDSTNGLEIDLAKALGKELDRPIEFVVVTWEDQIPALLERRTDIIMSGMSVTPTRQLRIAFSKPYLTNQLRAIFPRKSAAQFSTVDQLMKTKAKVGVIAGTTGQMFVTKNCPNAEIVPVTMRRDIAYYLTRGNRMDVFVDDIFALADVFANNEPDISYLQEPLSQEDVAWGFRPDDSELLKQVNTVLAQWKTDGTLERSFDRWIPYVKKIKTKPMAEK